MAFHFFVYIMRLVSWGSAQTWVVAETTFFHMKLMSFLMLPLANRPNALKQTTPCIMAGFQNLLPAVAQS